MMSINKDHPEDATQITSTSSIKFEWTPELVKLAPLKERYTHPLGPSRSPTYRPGMILLDPADTRECLQWVGLSDQKIIEIEHKSNDLFPECQVPTCGCDEKYQAYGRGYNEITFPLIDNMLKLFIQIGYIKKDIQLGLRPEFAIFCGLHKDDPRALEDPDLPEARWFCLGPADIMSDTLVSFWGELKEFMVTKLLYDGKAWKDRYGIWLVREGEDMDQAKARIDDKERERLKEQAMEEKKQIWHVGSKSATGNMRKTWQGLQEKTEWPRRWRTNKAPTSIFQETNLISIIYHSFFSKSSFN
ncbi:hypothetical protein N7488_005435 [Penicillium malachiteum]|nr:hypothetical protein N7488_005435 [Penicillium malachiteum]